MQTTNTRSENVNQTLAHPDFIRWANDWKTLNDTVDGGSSTVKEMGQIYLPATSGQVAAWNKPMRGTSREWLNATQYVDSSDSASGCVTQGAYAYYLYKMRAVFYEYPAETVRQMVGRMIYQPPTEKEFPGELSALDELATDDGQKFDSLIESIYKEQAKYSRCGVLADFPESPVRAKPPYLTIYGALRVLNWCIERNPEGMEVLKWVLLDESKYVQTGINWEYKTIVRVCAIDQDGYYFTHTRDITAIQDDKSKIADLNMLEPDEESVYPMFKGNRATEIPFVFINATNIGSTPELPFLKNVAEMSLAIYRGEADYRQALFVQGQATPVLSGISKDDAQHMLLGANGLICSSSTDFKASFLEVSGGGLSEMRESQTRLHEMAISEGMKLVNTKTAESGKALEQRTESQTVSLEQIVSTCEQGLIKLLQIVAKWGGIAGEIKLKLNREFGSTSITPRELVDLISAYNSGAPITREDIHKWSKKGGLAESEWEEVEDEMDMSGRNTQQNGQTDNDMRRF